MRGKNIWEHIVCDEIRDTMKLLGCDKKYLDGSASDFECFREWIAAYPYMRGNAAAKKAAEDIGALLGQNITADELCLLSARKIWRAFEDNAKLLELNGEKSYNDVRFANALSCDEKERIMKEAVDVQKTLEKVRATGGECFADFVGALENTENVSFKLIAPKGDFIRPDRYHAEEYYSEYIRGEKCKEELWNIILLQAIFELIFKNKCGIIQLYIHDEESIVWVRSLFEYLSARNLFVRVLLFVSDENAPSMIRDTCLLYDGVIPVLPNGEEEYANSFARVYPIGAALIDDNI